MSENAPLTDVWPINSYDDALACVQGWEFWQDEAEINVTTKQELAAVKGGIAARDYLPGQEPRP